MQIAKANNENRIVKSSCKFNNSQTTRNTTNATGKVNEFASIQPAMQSMQQRSANYNAIDSYLLRSTNFATFFALKFTFSNPKGYKPQDRKRVDNKEKVNTPNCQKLRQETQE